MKDESPKNPLTGPITSLPADAIHCVSGLVYQVLKLGRGDNRPSPDDIVQVLIKAEGDARNVFDSSVASSAPRTFVVKEAGPGLAEAFQLMTVGQRMRIWLPAYLAPNEWRGTQEETLAFEIEMLGFARTKEPPSIPRELTSPRRKE